ncbi:hypothetical protein GCM10007905_29680 [Mixta theicola]|nr:hypothetical protein GCM10007905_29680 [Mixta theicola]
MTPAELERLKRDVSLAAVAESQNRKLTKQGKDLVTLCPFHREKTPSCVISPDKNLYHCFGCNEAGSVLDWLQHTERLAHEVLGRTLDEMPPQTRKLLSLIQQMVREKAGQQNCQPAEVRFTRRDIRAWTNWSDNQLKVHCMRLSEMEYLLLHGGSRGHLLRYELLWNGGDGEENHLCGLLNMDENEGSNRKLVAGESKLSSSWCHVGAKLGDEKPTSEQAAQGPDASQACPEQNAVIRRKKKTPPPPSPSSTILPS